MKRKVEIECDIKDKPILKALKSTGADLRAHAKYNKAHFRVNITLPTATGELVKKAAATEGMMPGQFCMLAVLAQLAHEKTRIDIPT